MSDKTSIHISNKRHLIKQVDEEDKKSSNECDESVVDDEYDPNWREEFFAKNKGKYSL